MLLRVLCRTYQYGNNAGPHALTSLNGQVYVYDDNGNNIGGGGRNIVYSTFDKPTSISRGGNTVAFAYGIDRARYRRIDQGAGGTTTTRYIGNVEIIERPNGTQERKRYIGGVAIETGFYTGGSETGRETLYTLKDHLGSLDVLVNSAGQVEQKLSFGPWGQRRDATNWEEVDTSNLMIDLGPTFDISRSTRGFTGHEMVDSVGIVHMNGRIYDPLLGRFLQSDNYVQDPTNTQSHNRYSYVWNNPLNATDPSGEFVFTLFAVAVIAKGSFDAWAIGAIIAAATTADAIIAGADYSDAFLTGIISGVSAGAFAGVGTVLSGKAGTSLGSYWLPVKVVAHGTIGGMTAVLQGGKFGHGFAAAGFTAVATPFNNNGYVDRTSNGFSWRRVALGASIGGSASKLSGGKFANGAVTSAFASIVSEAVGPGGRSSGFTEGNGAEPSTPVGGSRPLTEGEAAMSQEVFGDTLDTDQTLVHRKKYWIFQRRGMAMAPNGDIYFHPKDFVDDFSTLGISGRSWFVHELTHVWQHQNGVNVALRGALNRNYNYAPLNRNTPFSSYGVEAQGSIVADYYRVKHGYSPRQGNATLGDYRAVLPF